MKMSKLKEVIREVINEELALESQASDDAKRQGLEYLGFGRWGKDGKMTHKTFNGKLQPVKQNNTPNTPSNKVSINKPTSSTSGNIGNDSPDPEKIDKFISAVGARIRKSGVLNTHAGQDIPIDKFEKMTGLSRKAAQKYSDTNDGPEADFSYDEETGMVTIQSPEGREDWGA